MYAVIRMEDDRSVTKIRTCRTKEAALIAAQMEKDRTAPAERGSIRAVAMDDEGYSEILW